jgi:hypothetical protein
MKSKHNNILAFLGGKSNKSKGFSLGAEVGVLEHTNFHLFVGHGII